MQFPILSVIVFTPIVTGLVLLLLPGDRKNLIRWVALAAASATQRIRFLRSPGRSKRTSPVTMGVKTMTLRIGNCISRSCMQDQTMDHGRWTMVYGLWSMVRSIRTTS